MFFFANENKREKSPYMTSKSPDKFFIFCKSPSKLKIKFDESAYTIHFHNALIYVVILAKASDVSCEYNQ